MVDELLTRTSDTPKTLRPAQVIVPYLYLVLECERLSSLGARFCLADIARVEIGRGVERRWVKDPARGLRLELPDRFLSQRHVEIVHADGAWRLRDLGSKNGTFVGAAAVSESVLADGDVIELGHSFFLFKMETSVRGGRSVVDANALSSAPGLRTLVPSLEQSFTSVATLASSSLPLVILGETGTGKEVMARNVHQLSGRPGAFIGVNCGALPPNLVESELFGSKKGAFSGATEDRIGLVRSADRGTLLLDEIGDLPLTAQAVLLRTLQEAEVRAVGSAKAVPVDVRVLAATHHDLEGLVKKGRFRADLLARLSGFTVRLPALRERRADLGLLIAALAKRSGSEAGAFTLTVDAARAMLRYEWAMNIRELEQVLRAALVLAGSGQPADRPRTIGLEHLPENIRSGRSSRPPPSVPRTRRAQAPDASERRAAFIATMEAQQGNVSAVARALGIARMQVHRWIRLYGVNPEDYRPSRRPDAPADSERA